MKELLSRYSQLKSQSNEIEGQLKALRDEIINEMRAQGQIKVSSESNSASIQRRTKVRYDLEQMEFDLLAQGIPTHLFSTSKVDLKKVESLLAEGSIDIEVVERNSTVTESEVLVVREVLND